MLFLNIEHAPAFLRRIRWLKHCGALNWRRRDYLRPQTPCLKQAALDAVAELCRRRCAGPVFMLVQPRQFGVAYNPATFYFVHDGDDDEPAYLLVEVHNTPWNERFCYAAPYTGGGTATAQLKKHSHVSPFNPMQMDYRWRFTRPAEKFAMVMECRSDSGRLDLTATMTLRRRPFTVRRLLAGISRQPFVAAANLLAIYRQAFTLWRKGAPVYSHPRNAAKQR